MPNSPPPNYEEGLECDTINKFPLPLPPMMPPPPIPSASTTGHLIKKMFQKSAKKDEQVVFAFPDVAASPANHSISSLTPTHFHTIDGPAPTKLPPPPPPPPPPSSSTTTKSSSPPPPPLPPRPPKNRLLKQQTK